jgi:hypothetical protein
MEQKTQKSYTIQKSETSVSQNSQKRRNFVITKKIAKHGNNAIIVIPKFLQEDLKPKTIVEVRINVVKEAENE